MKVFISWSGERSQAFALLLQAWLQRVIPSVETWISTDIEKGARGADEIANALEAVKFGIFCLTPENRFSPWIHFEAGAISKTKDARSCTLLFDGLKPSDIAPPLGQFQHTVFGKEEMRALVGILNSKLPESGKNPLSQDVLDDLFGHFWDQLVSDVAKVPAHRAALPRRTLDEKVDEILGLLREGNQGSSPFLLVKSNQKEGSNARLASSIELMKRSIAEMQLRDFVNHYPGTTFEIEDETDFITITPPRSSSIAPEIFYSDFGLLIKSLFRQGFIATSNSPKP